MIKRKPRAVSIPKLRGRPSGLGQVAVCLVPGDQDPALDGILELCFEFDRNRKRLPLHQASRRHRMIVALAVREARRRRADNIGLSRAGMQNMLEEILHEADLELIPATEAIRRACYGLQLTIGAAHLSS